MATMTAKRKKTLRQLAIYMNRMQEMPIPPVGGILELMDMGIRQEEADFLLKIGTWPLTRSAAQALSGMEDERFEEFFARLLQKGLIMPSVLHDRDRADTFELMPLVPGWIELQLLHGESETYEKEFARKLEALVLSLKKLNVFPLRPLGGLFLKNFSKPYITMGTIRKSQKPDPAKAIPINQEVKDAVSSILPSNDVYALVDRSAADNLICILPCFCRKWHRYAGAPCRFDIPKESCMVVGPFARHVAQMAGGRLISKKEALKALEASAKAGAVHSLFHERDNTGRPETAICSCCWDCCGVLGGFNRGAIPLYYKCHYQAAGPDPALCTGCGKCVKHCPTAAITLSGKKAVIKKDICIGCGQCTLQCPQGAVELVPCQRDVLVPVPKKSHARIGAKA